MNSKMTAAKISAGMLIGVMALSVVACGKRNKPTIDTAPSTSEMITTTTTTAPTTSLSLWTGPLTNDQQVTWKETTLDQQVTYYAKVTKGEFLNIRKGPGTEYSKVGTLSRGQSICECSSMVELQPSKLTTWVRFPSLAPGSLAQLDRATAF